MAIINLRDRCEPEDKSKLFTTCGTLKYCCCVPDGSYCQHCIRSITANKNPTIKDPDNYTPSTAGAQ